MGVQLFAWFIFVLLASHIQYVHCPSFDSCRDHSSDLSEDPCGNSTVTVSTYLSPNDTILPWISFILSCFIFIVPLTETYDLYVEYHRPSFFLMCGMICEDTKIIGWIAVALGVLHYFRIASTAYYDSFNVILFSSSVLGCCNGFLWLYHPRLCISFEYKIGSYIIGCLRGLEAFLWLSRLIAPMLSKMERTTIAPPQPDKPKYKVHVW